MRSTLDLTTPRDLLSVVPRFEKADQELRDHSHIPSTVSATVLPIEPEHDESSIVDDEPAPVGQWLPRPALCRCDATSPRAKVGPVTRPRSANHRPLLLRKYQDHYRPSFLCLEDMPMRGRTGPRRSSKRTDDGNPRTSCRGNNWQSSENVSRQNKCTASTTVPRRRR